MKYYYDTEHRCVLSERELQDEFIHSGKKSFCNYVNNCLTVNNGTLIYIGKKANYKAELHQCISEDKIWKDYYKTHHKGNKKYSQIVKDLINYVFDSDYNPYLERRYIDISWLEVADGVYLNLDNIWEMYCDMVREI